VRLLDPFGLVPRTRDVLGSVAGAALDRTLASDTAAEVVDRVLASPLARRTVEKLVDGPLVDWAIRRITDRLLADGTAERLAAAVLVELLDSEELWEAIDEIARSPSVTEAITHQGAGFADQVAVEVGERSRRADDRLERIARRWLRRAPRPAPT
jgi:hypothetical protein